MAWEDVFTHGIAFLAGAGTLAVGQYIANKYTDKRRLSELEKAEKKRFREVEKAMPDLVQEMREDLKKTENALKREFLILPNERVPYKTGRQTYLAYYEDQHIDLLSKVHVLENNGYVIDVTPRNTPIFRMTEEFVRFLNDK